MIEFFFQALANMVTPEHLFFLSLGTVLGLLVGVLPGDHVLVPGQTELI